MGLWLAAPRPARERFDGLHGDVVLLAVGQQCLKVGRILGVAHHGRVVGQQHAVEVELLQAALVHGGGVDAVAGNAQVAHQPLPAGLDEGFQRAAGAYGCFPPGRVYQHVHLP